MIKTIFDPVTRHELVKRIHNLNSKSKSRWGKMTVSEMVKHMTIWDEWILGRDATHVYKQTLLGKIFGKMALKSMVKDNTQMKKGMPAGVLAVNSFSGDIEMQKKVWANNVMAYDLFSNNRFVHDFFGVMTKEQIGILAYKHADHHLRQFGV